jgi:hypothetical protein
VWLHSPLIVKNLERATKLQCISIFSMVWVLCVWVLYSKHVLTTTYDLDVSTKPFTHRGITLPHKQVDVFCVWITTCEMWQLVVDPLWSTTTIGLNHVTPFEYFYAWLVFFWKLGHWRCPVYFPSKSVDLIPKENNMNWL